MRFDTILKHVKTCLEMNTWQNMLKFRYSDAIWYDSTSDLIQFLNMSRLVLKWIHDEISWKCLKFERMADESTVGGIAYICFKWFQITADAHPGVSGVSKD